MHGWVMDCLRTVILEQVSGVEDERVRYVL
jgi:hypothetical protein